MSGVIGVAAKAAPIDPVSFRVVDTDLCRLVESASSELRVIVVTGAPGNGVRTLIRDRLPQIMTGPHAVLSGAWPTFVADESALLIPSTKDAPIDPPPGGISEARIVIGCHQLDELPDWVRALAPREREILTLEGLSHAELQEFLAARLGGRVLGSTLRDLGSSAGFVPGIITEMVRALVREGVLMPIDGSWTLMSPIDARLFVSMLNNRLAGLDSHTRETFLRLCLVGSAELHDFDTAERSCCEQLLQEGLIRMTPEHRYEVRARILAETGQLLVDPHAAATVLRKVLQGAHPPEQAVLWGLRNDEPVRGDAIIQAIGRALERHEWAVANQLAGLAYEVLSEVDDRSRTSELLLLQAVALRFLDEPEESMACLAHADTLADAEELHVRIAFQRAEVLHYQHGDLDEALATLQLTETSSHDPQLRGDLIGHQAMHLIYGGRFREATAMTEKARKRPHRGHRWIRTRLSIAHCFGLVAQGKIQRGLRRSVQIGAHQLVPMRRETWVTEELSAAYFVSAFRAFGPAKLPRMMRRFEGSEAAHYRPDDTSFQLGRASWLLACGKVVEAAREASTCFANVHFHDPAGLSQAVAALRAQTSALRGEAHVARTMIAAAHGLRSRSSAVIAGGVEAHLSAAEYLLNDERASERTLARAERFTSDEKFGFAAEVLHTGVRFGDLRAAERLIELQPKLEGALTALHVQHARAVQAQDPVALVAIGEQLQEFGLKLHALEAYQFAASFPTIPELTAHRAEHESRELLEEIGEISHPLIREISSQMSLHLTKREREVQGLIVRGLSNREIADRLSLSTRTVEGHISRLYQKTGHARRDPARRR
ncbi:MAG: LuxR C-terminal-related transcriptional regulator [Leucobacter sp.]